jgi:hypothetical protein
MVVVLVVITVGGLIAPLRERNVPADCCAPPPPAEAAVELFPLSVRTCRGHRDAASALAGVGLDGVDARGAGRGGGEEGGHRRRPPFSHRRGCRAAAAWVVVWHDLAVDDAHHGADQRGPITGPTASAQTASRYGSNGAARERLCRHAVWCASGTVAATCWGGLALGSRRHAAHSVARVSYARCCVLLLQWAHE